MNAPYIGRATPRVEGVDKVTGRARYIADHDGTLYPGLHHGVVLGAEIASGRIQALHTADAEAAPGVVGVLTYRNAPRLTSVPIFPQGPAGESRAPLQDDLVVYGGQAIALVVACSPEEAQHAADLIRVGYVRELPRTTWSLLNGDIEPEDPPEPLQKASDIHRGDADAGLAEAAVVVEVVVDTPGHSQSAMELASTVAVPDGAGGLLIHDSTQWVLGCRNMVSRALGLPLDKVRVVAPLIGGGFGSKCFTYPHTVLAAAAAQRFGVPVRIVLTRSQMHLATGCRPQAHQTITVGADSAGLLTAIRQHAVSQTSIHDRFMRAAGEVTEVLYACPNLEVRNRVLPVNTTTPTNMRAPAESYGSFLLETAIDELAARLALDPVELRLRNIPDSVSGEGTPFSTHGLRACLDEGAAAFGWNKRPLGPGMMRDGDELIGWGMALASYGAYRSQAAVRATLIEGGIVELCSATHEIGSGTTTLMAQIAADVLGLPIDRVRVVLGDTDLPAAPVHGASRTAGTIGPAVKAAAEALQDELERLAPGAPLEQIFALTGRNRIEVERRAGPPELDDKAFATLASGINTIRMPKTKTAAMYAFAAHFVEVRVRPATGAVRVTRMLSRCDIGRVINPMGARSQVLGGLVFGLGMALSEQIVTDPVTGRVISDGITEYAVPEMGMMAAFDIGFVGEPDLIANEIGAKGVGEIGTVSSAAAIANAVWHATGRRCRRLPIGPDKLLSVA